jgi:hypothetical protein
MYIKYKIVWSFYMVEFSGKTETVTGRRLNATEEFVDGCHL